MLRKVFHIGHLILYLVGIVGKQIDSLAAQVNAAFIVSGHIQKSCYKVTVCPCHRVAVYVLYELSVSYHTIGYAEQETLCKSLSAELRVVYHAVENLRLSAYPKCQQRTAESNRTVFAVYLYGFAVITREEDIEVGDAA